MQPWHRSHCQSLIRKTCHGAATSWCLLGKKKHRRQTAVLVKLSEKTEAYMSAAHQMWVGLQLQNYFWKWFAFGSLLPPTIASTKCLCGACLYRVVIWGHHFIFDFKEKKTSLLFKKNKKANLDVSQVSSVISSFALLNISHDQFLHISFFKDQSSIHPFFPLSDYCHLLFGVRHYTVQVYYLYPPNSSWKKKKKSRKKSKPV